MSSPSAPADGRSAAERSADEHDRRLLAQVHPSGWRNPAPAAIYDLTVIGGGTAGLVTAAGAAALGARVALIERSMLGGDCLNTGCVPSKALLRSARLVAEARQGAAVGVAAATTVDFPAVMARVRARRADLAHADSAARLTGLGVDLFFGDAALTSPRTLSVANATLTFRRAVIASGSRPVMPPVPGLDAVPVMTTETLWRLREQPRELVILGAGAVGCEMAQAFSLLGTRVTLVDVAARVLPAEDADAAGVIAARLASYGVQFRLGAVVESIAHDGARFRVSLSGSVLSGDAVLVAAGRRANIEGLALHAAGVSHGPDGIEVDDFLRTANRRIYAAGDVCSRFKFTHAADAMARLVIQNALFHGRRRVSSVIIPWCTFTTPELAHVGINQEGARAAAADTITVPLSEVDRAVVDDDGEGFVRLHHRGRRVLGATIVAPQAGEMIGIVASLMRRRGSIGDLASEVWPYPTLSLALRRAGDLYRRQSLTPRTARLLKCYFRFFR